jgi:hypothetical protein
VDVCRAGGVLFDLVDKARLELLVVGEAAQKAMDLFQMFDRDGNGALDLDEMTTVVSALAAADEEGYMKDELEDSDPGVLAEMVRMEFAADGNSSVSRAEFVAGCTLEDGMLTDLIAAVDLTKVMVRAPQPCSLAAP